MSQAATGDPWDWPVDTVVQYLCADPGPLFPAFSRSLNRDELIGRVRNNDLCGEFLLELDDTPVKEHLGVVSFGLLVTFRRIIQSLRQQSQKWQAQSGQNSRNPIQESLLAPPTTTTRQKQDVSVSTNHTAEPANTPVLPAAVDAGEETTATEPQESLNDRTRRVALVLATDRPTTNELQTNFIDDDVFDHLLHWEQMSDDEVLPSLGSNPSDEVDSEADTDVEDDEHNGDDGESDKDYEETQNNDLHELNLRNVTGENGGNVDEMQIEPSNSISLPPNSSPEDEDEGNSDLDESTAEFGEENTGLTPLEARIRDAEYEQVEQWKAKKQPKLELKAYEIWSAPRDRFVIRDYHEQMLKELRYRLANLESKLIQTATLSELDDLVNILEPTIHDICETEWKISLLFQEHAPMQLSEPAPKNPQTKSKRRVNKALDEEDLTSNDDLSESDDDFIVHDQVEAEDPAVNDETTKAPVTDNRDIASNDNVGTKRAAEHQADQLENDTTGSSQAMKPEKPVTLPDKVHLPPFWDIGGWTRRASIAWAKLLVKQKKHRHFLAWNIAQNIDHWTKAQWFVHCTPLDKTPWSKLKTTMKHMINSDNVHEATMPIKNAKVSEAMYQIGLWYVCWESMTLINLLKADENTLRQACASAECSERKGFAVFWDTLRQIDSHWDSTWKSDELGQEAMEITGSMSQNPLMPSKLPDRSARVSMQNLLQSFPSNLSRVHDREHMTANSSGSEPIIRNHKDKRKAEEPDTSDEEPIQETRREKKVKRDKRAESQRAEAAARMKQHIKNAELVQKPSAGINGMENVYVNPGAQDEKDFIPINDLIKGYLKKNQREGIAFMWREVVEAGEGALLAHTMGLGKTLQCITLLTTIAEAARTSKYDHIIPQSLRPMKVAVVAPPALIENWHEEFIKWAPRMSNGRFCLGDIHLIASHDAAEDRPRILQHWSESKQNEVLLISYSILSRLLAGKDYQEPLRGNVREILQSVPDIVIADEAQHLRSSRTLISTSMAGFSTTRRIALTGSPLSNNLEEYFSLINWACKGFLGPEAEFRAIHANPIKHGLYNDSALRDYRRALVKLHALERILEPKVHRAGWEDMLDMPEKTEFTIHLPASDLQRSIYDKLVNMIDDKQSTDNPITVMMHLNALKILGFHPACFEMKLRRDKENLRKLDGKSSKSVQKQMTLHEKLQRSPQRLQNHDDAAATESSSTRSTTPMIEDEPVQNDALDTLDELDSEPRDPFLSLVHIEAFLQYFSEPHGVESSKMSMVLKIIQYSQDEKVLVFSHSLIVLDLIETKLQLRGVRCKRIDGSSGSVHKRQQIVKAFNQDPNFAQVMLVSTKAGGVGLNLYAASRVILCDESWNPTNERQAIGRAYRLGQQKHVYVYRLMLSGSYEEALQNQAVFKEQLASRVVEKKAPARYAMKDFGKFLRPLAMKPNLPLDEFREKDPKVLGKILDNEAIVRIQMGEEFTRERRDPLTIDEEGQVNEILELRKLGKLAPRIVNTAAPTAIQNKIIPAPAMGMKECQRYVPPEWIAAPRHPPNSYQNAHLQTGDNFRFWRPQPSQPNTNTANLSNSPFKPSQPLQQARVQHINSEEHLSAFQSNPSQDSRQSPAVDLVDVETSEDDVNERAIPSIERRDRSLANTRPVSVSSDSGNDMRRPPSGLPPHARHSKAYLEANNQPISIRQRSLQVRSGIDRAINPTRPT